MHHLYSVCPVNKELYQYFARTVTGGILPLCDTYTPDIYHVAHSRNDNTIREQSRTVAPESQNL